ncbi:hypothetical protein I0D68_20055 [Pseudomonas lalucatii]|nr:hypothetical protein I0D68_20055 [Pseudomonas lalucatii]
MARDLKLEVVLHALDRASRPFKAIAGSGVGLARTLRDTRGELKGLQAQQKDIASFRSLKGASEQTASALQANRDTLRQLSASWPATSAPSPRCRPATTPSAPNPTPWPTSTRP